MSSQDLGQAAKLLLDKLYHDELIDLRNLKASITLSMKKRSFSPLEVSQLTVILASIDARIHIQENSVNSYYKVRDLFT